MFRLHHADGSTAENSLHMDAALRRLKRLGVGAYITRIADGEVLAVRAPAGGRASAWRKRITKQAAEHALKRGRRFWIEVAAKRWQQGDTE